MYERVLTLHTCCLVLYCERYNCRSALVDSHTLTEYIQIILHILTLLLRWQTRNLTLITSWAAQEVMMSLCFSVCVCVLLPTSTSTLTTTSTWVKISIDFVSVHPPTHHPPIRLVVLSFKFNSKFNPKLNYNLFTQLSPSLLTFSCFHKWCLICTCNFASL